MAGNSHVIQWGAALLFCCDIMPERYSTWYTVPRNFTGRLGPPTEKGPERAPVAALILRSEGGPVVGDPRNPERQDLG